MEKSLFFKIDNKALTGKTAQEFYKQSQSNLNRVTFIK